MPYKLEDREGMAAGVRRIVAEELDDALERLGTQPVTDEAVHEVRKSLKKSRSALRLLREDLSAEVRRRENAAMRDAAQRLSGARDAQVMLETLAKLEQDPRTAVPAAGVKALREVLEARRATLIEETDLQAEAAEAARELEAVRDRVDDWGLADEGFDAAAAGLRRIHRGGRDAMETALRSGDDEPWHEWRKRVKDLWYASRVLKPVAPGQLSGTVAEAGELSDVLGDHNDLAVLSETVSEHGARLPPGHAELLQAGLRQRRDRLRLAAVPLGTRLYAERPRAFARRIGGCWEARDSQAAADAHWMPPEQVAQVRGILEAKETASPAQRRRLSAALPGLGFRIKDFEKHVPSHPGGFSVKDFDSLVARGIVRVGTPPAPGRPSAVDADGGRGRDGAEPRPQGETRRGGREQRNGGSAWDEVVHSIPRLPRPPRADLLRGGVSLAAAAARWARRRLSV